MNYKEELIEKIDKLLNNEISVPEFEKVYYLYFLNEVPENALDDEDNSFFAEVQEKLDWTSEKPTKEERDNGWIDNEEYVKWLKKEKDNWLKK